MKVLHISTECYPAAKAGGMGDVVGSLPKYLPDHGAQASVIIPRYKNSWFEGRNAEKHFESNIQLGKETIEFSILYYGNSELGFPLYAVEIPGKFDRPHVYLADDGEAYPDEIQRNLSFQIAVLKWVISDPDQFDLLHCHDHMTGLISFMMQFSFEFNVLKSKPSFFTIHNGQYRGIIDWSHQDLLPPFDVSKAGLLDWDGSINCLATAIKCSWRITTVSPSYLEELQRDLDTLTSLARFESYKSVGILNGIDTKVWDPRTDPMINTPLKRSPSVFKTSNKKSLAADYDFKNSKILVSFIGRFAYEKSADLLADAFRSYLEKSDKLHFFILGSGDKNIENDVLELQRAYPDNVTAVIAYNEKLAHQIYAASDFILMPSRFEPCGLNQMYAMRYGTVPIVRQTGGLRDTVPDIGDEGNGIGFLNATVEDIVYSLERAEKLFGEALRMKALVHKIMDLDYSWGRSAELYVREYEKTINQ